MTEWIIDPDHSVAAFAVQHLTVANVHGQFNHISGRIFFFPHDRTVLSLEMVIGAAGIHTGVAKRDEHLRSPDFFDVALFPTITFRSTGYEAGSAGKGKLTGQLTIHNITRTAVLDTVISGPVKSPEEIGGEITIGLSARAVINREDFGMHWNIFLADGRAGVGRDIAISLDLEADMES